MFWVFVRPYVTFAVHLCQPVWVFFLVFSLHVISVILVHPSVCGMWLLTSVLQCFTPQSNLSVSQTVSATVWSVSDCVSHYVICIRLFQSLCDLHQTVSYYVICVSYYVICVRLSAPVWSVSDCFSHFMSDCFSHCVICVKMFQHLCDLCQTVSATMWSVL